MSNLRKSLRLKSLGEQSSSLPNKFELIKSSDYCSPAIFESCSHCGSGAVDMSSIPMGAFAAFKVRDNQEGGGGSSGKQPGQSFFQKPSIANDLQYNPPAQYNGKLMNSIWGMYNRYSVHNIKSHIAFDKV